MSKGVKFRENPRFSYEEIEIALHKDVDRFAEKWASEEREGFELDLLS